MERKEELLRKFGKELTILRKAKGLSTGELAVAAQLEPEQVRKIEAGQVNLLFTTVLALARGLEVSPDELLRTL
jgi:transcriptional regulator with XRE-family HTH domain